MTKLEVYRRWEELGGEWGGDHESMIHPVQFVNELIQEFGSIEHLELAIVDGYSESFDWRIADEEIEF